MYPVPQRATMRIPSHVHRIDKIPKDLSSAENFPLNKGSLDVVLISLGGRNARIVSTFLRCQGTTFAYLEE